jgi:hypothetical protein
MRSGAGFQPVSRGILPEIALPVTLDRWPGTWSIWGWKPQWQAGSLPHYAVGCASFVTACRQGHWWRVVSAA